MKRFKIIGEAHSGVIDCEQESVEEIDALDCDDAMCKFAAACPKVQFYKPWGCWLMGARKIWAEEVGAS